MCFQGSRCRGRYGGLLRGSTAAALHPEPCHACRALCSQEHLSATPSLTGTPPPPQPCVGWPSWQPFPRESPFPGQLGGLFPWHGQSNYFPGTPTFPCREGPHCAPFNKAELYLPFPPKTTPCALAGPFGRPRLPSATHHRHRRGSAAHGVRMGVLMSVRGCSWGSSSGSGRRAASAWSARRAPGRNIPSGAGRRQHIHECCWDLASQHLPSHELEGV